MDLGFTLVANCDADNNGGHIYRTYYENGDLREKSRIGENGLWHGERIFYDSFNNVISHDVWLNSEPHAKYSELSEIDRFELSLKWGIIWF